MERPSYLPARTNKLAEQAVAGLGGQSPPHLSIAGNRFTLIDPAGNEKPFSQLDQQSGQLYCDVIIADINENVSKIYYRDKFDPSATDYKPPTCFSDNGVAPSQQAAEPQSPTCAACPHNAWGSKISEQSGKQVKSCNDLKKLAFVAPGEQMPFLMRVPPATLKNFKTYAQTVAGHGADLCEVVTRLMFESQGVIKFAPVGWIDQPMAAFLTTLEQSKATDALVGRNDIPNTRPIGAQQAAALPAPVAPTQTAPQLAPAAPQAAPPSPPAGIAQPAFMAPAAAAPPAAFAPPPPPPPAQTAPLAGTTEGAPTPRRTRGPNKPKGTVETAGNAAAQAAAPANGLAQAGGAIAGNADDIPPFLRRNPPAPEAPPQPSFGMAQPAPAPAGLEEQLNQAFALPTK